MIDEIGMLAIFAQETDEYRGPGELGRLEVSEPSSGQWQPEILEAPGRSF